MICIFKFRHDRTNVYNWEGLQTYIMESCLVANFCETEFQLGILKMTLIPVPARLDSDSKDQNTIEPRWLKQNIVISKKWFFNKMVFSVQLEQFNRSNPTGKLWKIFLRANHGFSKIDSKFVKNDQIWLNLAVFFNLLIIYL